MKLHDYDWYEESETVTCFYHGTTDALNISGTLLPPDVTGILREEWRHKLTHKVFFTDSLGSAIKFAKKAVKKYGGNPIVFTIRPEGDVWHVNTNEYVADSAIIEKVVCIN